MAVHDSAFFGFFCVGKIIFINAEAKKIPPVFIDHRAQNDF